MSIYNSCNHIITGRFDGFIDNTIFPNCSVFFPTIICPTIWESYRYLRQYPCSTCNGCSDIPNLIWTGRIWLFTLPPLPDDLQNLNINDTLSLNSQKVDVANQLAISLGSINFCLFKFTYIWQTNGRAYWAYLIRVDRTSVSGFRWSGWKWVYFRIDLRIIEAFVC